VQKAAHPEDAGGLFGDDGASVASGLAGHRATLLLGRNSAFNRLLALQWLAAGAQRDEPGCYISFCERDPELTAAAARFGWDLHELHRRALLCRQAYTPQRWLEEGRINWSKLTRTLGRHTRAVNARRIVLDSMHLLLAPSDSPEDQICELIKFRDWLLSEQLTAIFTVDRLLEGTPGARAIDCIHYVADCVAEMEAVNMAEQQTAGTIRFLKYRGCVLQDRVFPIAVRSGGIQILLNETGGRAREQTLQGLAVEMERSKGRFAAQIQSLDQFLEIKQAELDFLIEKQSESLSTAGFEAVIPPPKPRPSFQ
jgi:KaiC/GvpD/RAD55 family RecA-like ATPase